jgi:hypothetical protein
MPKTLKEGDTCPACQTGILEYVRIDKIHVELKCNTSKCSDSNHGVRLSDSGKGRDALVEHRDDHDQTIIREKLGQR